MHREPINAVIVVTNLGIEKVFSHRTCSYILIPIQYGIIGWGLSFYESFLFHLLGGLNVRTQSHFNTQQYIPRRGTEETSEGCRKVIVGSVHTSLKDGNDNHQ